MPTFTFNHIALAVTDVEASMAFYQRVFQLPEIPNTASSSKTRWLSLGEGKQLHLISRPHLEVKTHKAVHFALSTADLDGLVAHLEALKIPYSDWKDVPNQVFVRQDGKRQVYFQDPDGYWVEVNDDV